MEATTHGDLAWLVSRERLLRQMIVGRVNRDWLKAASIRTYDLDSAKLRRRQGS